MYVTWAGIQVAAVIAAQVDAAAGNAGLPRNVLRAIVLAEDPYNTAQGGDGGRSFGILQLFTQGGQGDGYTPAQLLDVDTNLAIGVPPIAEAWARNAGRPAAQRIARTAAESGHPRDPLAMDHGTHREQVEAAIARIVALYETLEAEDPALPAAALAGFVPIIEGARVQDTIERGIAWVKTHPREAAAAAGAAAIGIIFG